MVAVEVVCGQESQVKSKSDFRTTQVVESTPGRPACILSTWSFKMWHSSDLKITRIYLEEQEKGKWCFMVPWKTTDKKHWWNFVGRCWNNRNLLLYSSAGCSFLSPYQNNYMVFEMVGLTPFPKMVSQGACIADIHDDKFVRLCPNVQYLSLLSLKFISFSSVPTATHMLPSTLQVLKECLFNNCI